MTWHHVFIITAALLAPLVCGFSSSCSASLPAVLQLSTVVISGALGHAGAQKLAKRGEPESVLPREPKYDSNEGRRRT
jgi:hypothetical protein